ncbi:uncharacterized protein BO87DRAFT_442732 [Aspergillus neoniger CBS 115656]|uniref:Uncharacterized protein n=1 Tax=Aspergillus neoniger (strain CBS 115656) TaxID=1448310 RepID=A0A318YVM4_ASPNB|nr:hypothetical protein BO87DRAFT_442732 [Aspergillus neoniger CBS 115656]PYH38489.1 hypothetical protein BO87DRAFT_442732 [Aspergillus neoniger CBS 115656]
MGIYFREMKEGDHGWKGKRKRESHYAGALTLCPPLSLPCKSLTTGVGCLCLADHTIRRGRIFHGKMTPAAATQVYVIRSLSRNTHTHTTQTFFSLCKTIGGLNEVVLRALSVESGYSRDNQTGLLVLISCESIEQHLNRYGDEGLSVRVAMILHHRASTSNDRVKASSQVEPNSGWHHDCWVALTFTGLIGACPVSGHWTEERGGGGGGVRAKCLTCEDSSDKVVPVGMSWGCGMWYLHRTKNNNAGRQPWNGRVEQEGSHAAAQSWYPYILVIIGILPPVCMVIFRGILASLGFTRRFEELPERMLHCKLGACLSTMRSRASPPSLRLLLHYCIHSN